MINDLRYAIRQLLKNPGFTMAAVVTLALGIGASTAIFSVLHAVLLRALPYRQAERLVAVWQMNLERGARDKVTCGDYADWKARNHVFEDMAYSMDEPYTLTDTGTPQSVVGFQFSTNLFSLLGAQPLLGRTFLPEEGQTGKDHVLVLSHRLWEKRFASDRSVVGRSVRLNGEPYTIIGVMPPEFAHPGTFVDLWTPLVLSSDLFENRKLHLLHVVARLRPGVGVEQAQKEMEGLAAELARQYSDTNKNWGSRLAPIRDLYTGNLRRVWQKAMDLVVTSYEVTKPFPQTELYGLVSQIQRAVVSIPANIAEGHGREHLGDYMHHLSMANGSLMELETHFLLAERLGYLKVESLNRLLDQTAEVGRMLAGLIRSLKNPRPGS